MQHFSFTPYNKQYILITVMSCSTTKSRLILEVYNATLPFRLYMLYMMVADAGDVVEMR